jgi:hypothetical protein
MKGFEDNKGLIIICISKKNRQHNGPDTSMEDNSTFRNILIVDKPSVDPDHTDFPDVIPDVDAGVVSIFIFLIFVLK